MADFLVFAFVILLLSVSQFIAMLMVRRFDKICSKIKAKLSPKTQEYDSDPEVENPSTVIMDDISSEIPLR